MWRNLHLLQSCACIQNTGHFLEGPSEAASQMAWTALAPPLTPSVLFCPSGLASLSIAYLLGHSHVHSFITYWASNMSQALF